jgi:hydrogenase maturation protease
MPDTEQRILVMGVGNPLMRDEGAGPRVVEVLREGFVFPDHVEVVDAGTMGFTILDLLRDVDHLIVVDAIKDTGHDAGTVMILTPDEISPNQVMHSLHDTALIDVLQAAELMSGAPETVAVGIQIESIEEWVLELSEAVEQAIPIAAAAVIDQLNRLGVTPEPREDADVDARIIEAVRTYAPMPEEALRPADSES